MTEIFIFGLSDTTMDAPFLIASKIKEFPSLFLPFIAKKISFFLMSLEFIEALFNFNKFEISSASLFSFKILIFRLSDRKVFFYL